MSPLAGSHRIQLNMKIVADNNLGALKYDPDGDLVSAIAETVSIAVILTNFSPAFAKASADFAKICRAPQNFRRFFWTYSLNFSTSQ